MILLDNIRKLVLARRNALSREEIEEKSKKICEKIQPYLHGNVAAYNAIDSEADLGYLSLKEVQLCLPVCTKTDMTFHIVDQYTKYQQSHYGILEPVNAEIIDGKDIDVFLVPMVAFDERCNRMGHGKGYYDRYLALTIGLKIGVAFECQKDILQLHAYDIAMDIVITEENIYKKATVE